MQNKYYVEESKMLFVCARHAVSIVYVLSLRKHAMEYDLYILDYRVIETKALFMKSDFIIIIIQIILSLTTKSPQFRIFRISKANRLKARNRTNARIRKRSSYQVWYHR